MRIIASVFVVLCAVVLVGCAEKEPPGPTPEQIAQQKVQQAMSAGEATADGPLEMVEVADEGCIFDPPVQIDQLPDGVFYCDMGTVHYAAKVEGDGKCPECGMNLSHKGAAQE